MDNHVKTLLMEQRVLAVDPSTKAIGWAVFEGGRYSESGAIAMGCRPDNITAFITIAKRVAPFSHLVVEDTYYHGNVATLKVLVGNSMAVQIAAGLESPDARLWEVPASSWQAKQLKAGRTTKRADRKRLSILVAREIAGRDVTEDEADAINLGDYFVRFGGFDGRFEKGAGVADARKKKGMQDRNR